MVVKGKFLQNRPAGWATTVVSVLLLLAIAAVLYYMIKGREGFADGAGPTVTVFLMEGCPYCDQFKPEWEVFQKMVKEDGLAIKTVTVDATDKTTTSRYGVSSFPTIIVEKDKKRENYEGKRTAADLLAFTKAF